MSATGHRSSATGAGDSTCIAEKGARSDPPHDRRRVPKERDARREAQGYRGGVLFVAVVSQPVFNTPEADLACARATDQGRTRQRRDADAQVTSWRGGAGQAAIGTSSDSCGSKRRAGGLGSRLKDGRADSAPCDQLVCYTRCDFCSSTVSRTSATLTNQSRSDFHPRVLNASYYYRALRVVVDKNRDFKTR